MSGGRERRASRQTQVAIIQKLVAQLFDLGCQGALGAGTAARRPGCHMRQITMYLCRVVLSMPYQHIAEAVGRDRSTVIHGCAAIEDRRDAPDYDAFMDRCEQCVRVVFGQADEDCDVARS
ncbi:helix-turn-helix domain-containing protein [Pseudohoeflea suaedae]|nr:helix-turn-helix domain-containing protein [Pseudohoeflea suaedae]